MAKKKKRNEIKKNKVNHIELNGILISLLAILGIGNFGIVGNLCNNFFIFLSGSFYNVFLLGVLILGIYIIINRKNPDFFKVRLIGIYLLFLSVLIWAHMSYITSKDLNTYEILKETVTNFMNPNIIGGGIIGGSFVVVFEKLFSIEGTKIVTAILVVSSILLITNISLKQVLKFFKKGISKIFKRKNKKEKESVKVAINKAEDEFEEDKRIVVSSVSELIKMNEEKTKEEIKVNIPKEEKIEEKKEVIINTEGYKLPPISLLNRNRNNNNSISEKEIKENIKILEQVFKDFQIDGKIVAANVGPTITQYEMNLKAGIKVSKVLSIHKEIALALAAKDIRIEAPIPGKRTIGIELPNKTNQLVSMREVIEKAPESKNDSKLLVALGKSITNEPIFAEINKTPHLLVAGATGAGKSVCINTIITSILMRAKPDEVKMIMVDPKKVELGMYNGVPHLLAPVVTNPKKASLVLQKIVSEMEHRYDLFSNSNTKNIAGYNKYIEKKNETLEDSDKKIKLPYIVVIIDELADLMMVASKEVEDSIMRITQMARAAGIHLIIATQRPSTDIITGVIKANIPSRISFAVSSSIDSRTILDATGAEKLIGKGDMLFMPMGENSPLRIQGAFISEEEVERIVNYTVSQQKAQYDESLTKLEEKKESFKDENEYEDPLYNEIVEFVISTQKASASLLQRRFRLGYNRAARVIDLLENRGIIGPSNGSKPREVLVKLESDEE